MRYLRESYLARWSRETTPVDSEERYIRNIRRSYTPVREVAAYEVFFPLIAIYDFLIICIFFSFTFLVFRDGAVSAAALLPLSDSLEKISCLTDDECY